MIYITGDCHQNFERFNISIFPEQKEMTKDDFVIICGDFGGGWNKGEESKQETMLMDWLDCKSFTTLFVDGNHDTPILTNKAAQHYLEGIECMMYVKDDDKDLCLCHFPIAEWNGFFRDTWHIYGHIHCKKAETYEIMKSRPRALNAGCMINNYAPASFNELVRNNKIFKEAD